MKRINEVQQTRKLPERILQFGEGNFLRAFCDWMVDELNDKTDFNGSVVVVQPIERGLVDKLNEQDGLYTLYMRGIKNGEASSEHKVITSISRGINPYEAYEEYMKTAEQEEMRFVLSNTTEAGIYFEKEDTLDGAPQKSFGGKLTAWLYRRYKHFNGAADKGMVIIPCELILSNGEKLKEVILQQADNWNLEDGFKAWINESNSFCNTLVDRIVPGYPRDQIEEITTELGYQDQLVVEGEHFHLWVIEGPEHVKEELPFDEIGLNVLFVKDQTPYRTRKVRILNGAHTSMVPVGYLYGLRTVRETVEDEVLGAFIKGALNEEIIPTLSLPREELDQFAADVIDRFRNPYIKHYLMSIALNSLSKYKTRVLPSLLTYVEQKDQLPERLVFALSSLIRFYKGSFNGETIELKDDQRYIDFLGQLWSGDMDSFLDYKKLVSEVLGMSDLWQQDLNEVKGLTERVAYYLYTMDEKGFDLALKEVI